MNQTDLIDIQKKLSSQVNIPLSHHSYHPSPSDILFTLDIQYLGDRAFIALDVSEYSGKTLDIYLGQCEVLEPYVPQFFCFREGPPLLKMIEAMTQSSYEPDFLLIDGHGLAHPRKFGVACYIGVHVQKPTIGSAKRPLLPYPIPPNAPRGSKISIELGNEVLGYALRTQDGINPIFVSPGHLISVETSSQVVLNLSPNYRLPEPIRRADQAARVYAKGEMPIGGIDLGIL